VGDRPAARVIAGQLDIPWRKGVSPVRILIDATLRTQSRRADGSALVLSRTGRADRIDILPQRRSYNEAAKFGGNGGDIIIALAGCDFPEQSLNMPR
jgi:hypothetical protein